MVRLLTMLGTGKYESVQYYLAADPGRGHETQYAPVATAALARRPDEAVVLLTAKARQIHWEGCRAAFAQLGIEARPVDIPEGGTDEEVWQIFHAITGAVQRDDEVVLDVTHSFRHLPFVLHASLANLKAFRHVRVAGIYYGAYEARQDARVPLLDLGVLQNLSEWSYAVRTFAETGNPGRVGRLVREARGHVWERWSTAEPLLTGLARTLERLGWTLPTGLPLEAGSDATDALGAVDELLRTPSRFPLVNTVLKELRATLGKIAVEIEGGAKANLVLDRAELDRELRLVKLYADRGQEDRALLVLWEWVINRCLMAAERGDVHWLDLSAARFPMGRALTAVGVREELAGSAEERTLAALWREIGDRRNNIAHAGFRKDKVRDGRDKVRALIQECDERMGDDAFWRTAVPGPLGRVLVTPLGLSPGVLFTALGRLSPDRAFVVTSSEAEASVAEVCTRAGWDRARVVSYVVPDAHNCFDQVMRLLEEARWTFLGAKEVLVNVTGGTTAMQYLVERVAAQAERFGVPTTRYALLDRRPPREQQRDPYVLGEVVPLRGDEPAGDG